MATKSFFHDLDLNKSALLNVKLNPLTTAEQATLATGLGSGDKGLTSFNTDTNQMMTFNGTAFVKSNTLENALVYKGAVAANAVAPVSPVTGDFYKFNSTGSNTWNGAGVDIKSGDQAFYDGTTWEFIKDENSVAATDTIAGIVELATNAETLTGTDTVRAITPANLTSFVTSKQFARVYFASALTLVANTPLNINHALALSNRDSFTISVKLSNSEVSVDVDSVDVNNLTITSGIGLVGISVTVVGF